MTRITPAILRNQKGKTPIVCLTAYTAPFARILDTQVDLLLVGDSLGMVLYGMDHTQHVTLEMMIQHGTAVTAATNHACVVIDMPYGSYENSPEQALLNAKRIMDTTTCSAVKLEGGTELAETIALLTSHHIPVLGHIGLMPQKVASREDFKYQGRTTEEQEKIIEDAKSVSKAGAFGVVLECVPASLAATITTLINIPTIGIGGSADCDGQILVTEDMVGLLNTEKAPRFVKQFGTLGHTLEHAVHDYATAVKARKYPSQEHYFEPKKKQEK